MSLHTQTTGNQSKIFLSHSSMFTLLIAGLESGEGGNLLNLQSRWTTEGLGGDR